LTVGFISHQFLFALVTKVVVTGAAGFIGSHVADELERRGYGVVRSDILRPPSPNDGWRSADLTHADELIELTRGASVVCHIGGIGDVYQASRDPALAMSVNAGGTANILEAAKRNSVERFVFASTWEVYGPPRYEPVDELHPCHPGHPYSVSKLAGDLISQAYGEEGSLSTVVLRLGTAYGPRMRPTGVIPAFVHQALSAQPMEVQGDGSQFRQFIHAADIANAFALAIEAESPAGIYNIVGSERVSIRDLAEMVSRHIPAELVTVASRANDAPVAVISSKRAETDLAWQPQVPFSRGLEELIDLYVKDSRVTAA
jgi:nucleoside-diphosphate-sugar epimerase